MQITGKSGRLDRAAGSIGAGLLSFNGVFETPLFNNRGSGLLAVRRSFQGPLYDKILNLYDNVASARARFAATAGDIRSRDRHWRIVVGGSVLTQAAKVPDFRRELDRLFTLRIADKDRLLLDRWRNQDASPVATPPADATPPAEAAPVIAAPPAETAILGWVPRKLPDKEWGAALDKPTDRDLPPDLVGLSIEVTPRKGAPWVTKLTEVIETGDDMILVRTEGHPVFPSPAENAAATPQPDADGDGGGVKKEASPPSESEI